MSVDALLSLDVNMKKLAALRIRCERKGDFDAASDVDCEHRQMDEERQALIWNASDRELIQYERMRKP